jgi:hypothetical protein
MPVMQGLLKGMFMAVGWRMDKQKNERWEKRRRGERQE